jgi:uncharacterized protein YyaL (SSP411 family)
VDIILAKFADPAGGFFYTANDHEQLIARTKDFTDSSTPSGNAMAATAFLRLGKLLGRSDYLAAAESTIAAAVPVMQQAPLAAGQMLIALDRYLGPSHELVLVGDYDNQDAQAVFPIIYGRYLPQCVLALRYRDTANEMAHRSPQLDELFAGKSSPNGQPVLYICQNFACQAPAVGLAAIEMQLVALR